MKIVFNTRHPEAIASYHYMNPLRSFNEFCFNDWQHYDQYDVALFMTYPEDLEDLANAKKKYSHLKIGLVDPRGSQVDKYIPFVDFLVIDSVEMKDFFSCYGIPIFTYYEYPNIKTVPKNHEPKEPIVIGYHGNKLHLAGMYPNTTKAIELLGKQYKIEFWAMYDKANVGKCRFGMPENITVKHIQWSHLQWNDKNVAEVFPKVDIGIAPGQMPIKNLKRIKQKACVCSDYFNDNNDDYLIRFKMPSNPCRIVCFGKLGIPVVADFYPSALQFIQDEHNGLLACSTGGWYCALEKLICNHRLRQTMADNMLQTIKEHFDFEKQNKRLIDFLLVMMSKPKHRERIVIENPEDSLLDNQNFRKSMLQLKARNKMVSCIPNGLKIKLKQWLQKINNQS